MPVYLYWGEEEFNIEMAVRELRKKIIDPNFASINHKRFSFNSRGDFSDSKSLALLGALQSAPMFGDVLVEVNSVSLFSKGGKGSISEDHSKRLLSLVENLNSRIHLLFIYEAERESKKKPDGTLKITKTVQKIAEVREFPAFRSYEEAKIIDWITKRAASKSLKISRDAASLLCANIGTELRKLDCELEKLSVAVYPRTQVSAFDLEEMVSSNENIFKLLHLWINGDKTAASQELAMLMERNNPLKILSTSQTMTRRWLKIKALSEVKNSFEISKETGILEFLVKQDLERIKGVSVEKLAGLREKALRTEFRIKTGELPPELALETMIAG